MSEHESGPITLGQLKNELIPLLLRLDKAVMNIVKSVEDTTRREARTYLLCALVEQFGCVLVPDPPDEDESPPPPMKKK